jgi:plastocyanin
MRDQKTTRRRPWWLASLAGLALTALTTTHALGSSPASVSIKEFTFAPTPLAVRAGTTVMWTNHDEETHTITSATGSFGSGGLGNEETFAQTFTRPGTYEYFCALHPKMKAAVIVK